jgi:hypothetical protein
VLRSSGQLQLTRANKAHQSCVIYRHSQSTNLYNQSFLHSNVLTRQRLLVACLSLGSCRLEHTVDTRSIYRHRSLVPNNNI